MFNYKLNQITFNLYAIYNYKSQNRNPQWDIFFEDLEYLKRTTKYVKRNKLISKTLGSILNRIITSGNHFPGDSLGRLLYASTSSEFHPELYTLLNIIDRHPEICYETIEQRLYIVDSVQKEFDNLISMKKLKSN